MYVNTDTRICTEAHTFMHTCIHTYKYAFNNTCRIGIVCHPFLLVYLWSYYDGTGCNLRNDLAAKIINQRAALLLNSLKTINEFFTRFAQHFGTTTASKGSSFKQKSHWAIWIDCQRCSKPVHWSAAIKDWSSHSLLPKKLQPSKEPKNNKESLAIN